MHNLNPLNRNVLISMEEVIFHGPTSQTVDGHQITQAIIIAEERFIKKAICKGLYEELRNLKNKVLTVAEHNFQIGDRVNAIEYVEATPIIGPWYVTLWNEYLWKICAECVIYTATPTNFSTYTSQGEMVNNPKGPFDSQGAVSVSHKELTWKMDKLLMDRIDPLIAAMHEWLCDNKENFPLYDCKACACDEKGVSLNRKSGWIHIYKNSNTNCCNDD